MYRSARPRPTFQLVQEGHLDEWKQAQARCGQTNNTTRLASIASAAENERARLNRKGDNWQWNDGGEVTPETHLERACGPRALAGLSEEEVTFALMRPSREGGMARARGKHQRCTGCHGVSRGRVGHRPPP